MAESKEAGTPSDQQPHAVKVWAHGGSTGVCDYLMSDGTVRAMTAQEAKATQAPAQGEVRSPDSGGPFELGVPLPQTAGWTNARGPEEALVFLKDVQARDALWAERLRALARWKSTNAPRLEALEGLLRAARQEAAKGAEAVSTLESERAVNAVLTQEVERLRAELAAANCKAESTKPRLRG